MLRSEALRAGRVSGSPSVDQGVDVNSGWKFAAVSAVMTGAVIGGIAEAAAAEPPMMPEQGVAADRGEGWPVVPSGSPSGSGSESPSTGPSESGGSQVGIVGVAALGAGLIPLGAWVWRRRRARREERE
ncbi:hypothetical protein [Phytomonospora endophytica]|uniref:Gram-positive cocci surface proteins LPxTG domain-containing protein n=1 Tax=Phytomonospora endophytica TaxID=714109 RepID=A0A841FB55_9ACTN|nr:hypothetical protein [Phytomonospora endophytica]MBB6034501.1 hypothetical protein [Phytomonospora endophytica]GIG70408.1 hypothetical protein Pen01_67030 [Phytomonospora endophytica]